jgi:hypothetical protein
MDVNATGSRDLPRNESMKEMVQMLMCSSVTGQGVHVSGLVFRSKSEEVAKKLSQRFQSSR